jgi:uncharacterized repeat protein (TIGR03803 family)
MHSRQQVHNSLSRTISRAATVALAIVFVLALILIFAQPAQAQTFEVLYTFTGGQDGAFPEAGLTLDKSGNLYGTTRGGGDYGGGVAFKLSYKDSSWVLTPLHSFGVGTDGSRPYARVVFGPNGSLYGTTTYGGANYLCGFPLQGGCGTIFNLQPPSNASGCWRESPIYRFQGGIDGGDDGWYPGEGDLIFDQSGSLYGTTQGGGLYGGGTVFKLTSSNGALTESVLYSLAHGTQPTSGVIFDQAGNLYGTTPYGGTGTCSLGCGTVFQVTPQGSGWTGKTLYSFQDYSDGMYPYGGLVLDESGNLYGTTLYGGPGGGGTVYELTPSGGGWTKKAIDAFAGGGPSGGLVMDAAGNLYGTTFGGGSRGHGTVFKLTPSNGSWTYT